MCLYYTGMWRRRRRGDLINWWIADGKAMRWSAKAIISRMRNDGAVGEWQAAWRQAANAAAGPARPAPRLPRRPARPPRPSCPVEADAVPVN